MFQLTVTEHGERKLSHPAGNRKASFDLSRFFGRDAIREIIDELGLVEDDYGWGLDRRKVFHNGQVAITFSKDPWVDYPSDHHKENQIPVYKEEWGGKYNPLKPARSGYIRIVGDESEVMSAYNLIQWRSFNKDKFMNTWGV